MREDCPYSSVPQNARWRNAVGELPEIEIDPHAGETAPYQISRGTKIATAGSCFAQHLSRSLLKYGFNYVNEEPGPAWLSAEERFRYNYGTFSARYGNIYTPRQLLQLLERSLGLFEPAEDLWESDDSFKLDPFRPTIQPKGFTSGEELLADRKAHLALTRRLFESVDVFIFTLGLTESWRSKTDGAVFPLCPGCPHGSFDPEKYGFYNFSVSELISDLDRFLDRLENLNPKARVIFTVSPVPLIATMRKQHVLPATIASKSALRTAADEVCRKHATATYFASYEIVLHTFKSHQYFAADRRNVTPDAVEHVMNTFFRYFARDESLDRTDPEQSGRQPGSCAKPVCDEDQLSEALGRARVKS